MAAPVEFFEIRNWRKFQHYKKRRPPWVKLHFELLDSYDWIIWDDASRLLALACMLLATRFDGRVPSDPKYIKRMARLDDVNFEPLITSGFLLADASTLLASSVSVDIPNKPNGGKEGKEETRHKEAQGKKRRAPDPNRWADPDAVAYPEGMDTPEVRAAAHRWIAYKREQKQDFRRMSLEAALKRFAPADNFIAIVDAVIAGGWQGLRQDAVKPNGYQQPRSPARIEPKPGEYDDLKYFELEPDE